MKTVCAEPGRITCAPYNWSPPLTDFADGTGPVVLKDEYLPTHHRLGKVLWVGIGPVDTEETTSIFVYGPKGTYWKFLEEITTQKEAVEFLEALEWTDEFVSTLMVGDTWAVSE